MIHLNVKFSIIDSFLMKMFDFSQIHKVVVIVYCKTIWINNVTIVSVKQNSYRINLWGMNKDGVIDIMKKDD